MPNVEPVAPSVFSAPIPDAPAPQSEVVPDINPMPTIPGVENVISAAQTVAPTEPVVSVEPEVPAVPAPINESPVNSPVDNNYEDLKKEFMAAAEELFNNLYNKLNH